LHNATRCNSLHNRMRDIRHLKSSSRFSPLGRTTAATMQLHPLHHHPRAAPNVVEGALLLENTRAIGDRYRSLSMLPVARIERGNFAGKCRCGGGLSPWRLSSREPSLRCGLAGLRLNFGHEMCLGTLEPIFYRC
jgi:hypothetical protein